MRVQELLRPGPARFRLGFWLAGRSPGRPHFLCQFLLSTEKKTGIPRFSPTLLFTEPPLNGFHAFQMPCIFNPKLSNNKGATF